MWLDGEKKQKTNKQKKKNPQKTKQQTTSNNTLLCEEKKLPYFFKNFNGNKSGFSFISKEFYTET